MIRRVPVTDMVKTVWKYANVKMVSIVWRPVILYLYICKRKSRLGGVLYVEVCTRKEKHFRLKCKLGGFRQNGLS